jgi:hypothetical protein
MEFASMDDPEGMDRMREFMGPGQVDHQIRQAIQFAWILLPEGKRTIAEVEQVDPCEFPRPDAPDAAATRRNRN